jgi:H+-transporting ATPase
VVLVFGSQATLYAIRQRRRMWGSRPSVWLLASSVVDIVIALVLAVGGIAMTALPVAVIAGVLGAAVAFALVLDVAKIPVFAHLRIT